MTGYVIDAGVAVKRSFARAGRFAIDLGHPVYDFVYLMLAVREQCAHDVRHGVTAV